MNDNWNDNEPGSARRPLGARQTWIDPMPRPDVQLPPPVGYVARADYDAIAAQVARLTSELAAARAEGVAEGLRMAAEAVKAKANEVWQQWRDQPIPRDPMFLARSMQAQFCADAILALIPALAKPADALTPAAADVLAERERQIMQEGWTPSNDDAYQAGDLANAAACYAMTDPVMDPDRPAPVDWPWAANWWKPTTRRRDLIKAGALILAEIERMDRIAPPAPREGGGG